MIHHHAGAFVSPASVDHHPPDLRVRPVHLELDLRVDVPGRRLDGVITHTLEGREGADSITLNAVAFDSVRVEGPGVRAEYDGEELQLAWDTPFTEGEKRTVEVHYSVTDPATGLTFSGGDSSDPDRPLYAATDHETERARYWLPTVDFPSVAPTLAFHIRTDARFTSLANGALSGTDAHDDGTKTTHWTLEQPCPSYLTCFAIAEFAEWKDLSGPVEISAYAPSSMYTPEDLERSFDRTKEMLDWMPERLGVPFPYPKYAQFAVPFIGGAMENISLVSWDDLFVLKPEDAPELKSLVDIINLHEMAHTWFGDHVVCRDYAHAWLKESWATYMESCWYEHDSGADDFAYDLYVSAINYFGECKKRYVRPIVTRKFDSSWDMYDYHLYPGGAWRIHMLRKMMGDDVFWPAVRTYLSRFGGTTVETDDFRRVLEQASGLSLTRFFDEWLHRPGHPKVKGTFRWSAKDKEGVFELEQSQEDSKKNVGLFSMHLELAWWVEGERHLASATFDGRHLRHAVPMETAPERVRVDPEMKVLLDLDFDPGIERVRKQLEDDDLMGRLLAGNRLAKTAKRVDMDRLLAAYRADSHHGPRIQWATALADAKTELAKQTLCALAADHDEAESLAALFKACGTYRDSAIAEVLCKRLDGTLTPRAREAALEALGKQRGDTHLKRLVEATRHDNPFVQGGALRGLAETRHPDALPTLLESLQVGGLRSRARLAAAPALGSLANHLEDRLRRQALDALADALQDPIAKVRTAAANALAAARARTHSAALSAYRETRPRQEQVAIDRHLRALRRADDRGSLKRRIDELEQKLRRLEGKVAKQG